MALTFEIAYVLGVIVLMIIFLVIDRIKPSLVFLFATAFLLVPGIISPESFVSGLSNTSILTIFLLIIITGAINNHFNLTLLLDRLFGKTKTARGFILKMGAGVASVSAFMNNTPVVAMLMPYVYGWGKRNNVSPSKLLIPLSFAAIVGGVITLIGTSTNLVLNGLLEVNQLPLLGFSDFFVPGLLVAITCVLFLYFFAPSLLSDKKDLLEHFEENTRQYIVETVVPPNSHIIGQSVEQAGLRNLKGVFLAEIIRDQEFITAVGPSQKINSGDILLFAGETSQIFDLLKDNRGLVLSKKEKFKIDDNPDVYEAVITQNSSLDHKTAKEFGFRDKYNAAIVGIHRRGEKLSGKIGSVTLHAGDLLLLTGGPGFVKRNSRLEDLIVINTHKSIQPLSKINKGIFFLGLAIALTLTITGVLGLFESLLLVSFVQLLVGMINVDEIKNNISFDLLIILVTALALGQALVDSGAASYFTDLVFAGVSSWHPLMVLGSIFLITFILTSLVTNVAAISIIFPVVFTVVSTTDIPDKALYLTAAFAASCCFVTPYAYQTNLMVMEAGNYRFKDFFKIGLPLSVVYALVFLTYSAIKFDMI